MGRDYKYRANQNKKKKQQTKVVWWKWVLIFFLISLFIIFLVKLRKSTPHDKQNQKMVSSSIAIKQKKVTPKHQNKQTQEPRYDFYTILPETEIVVPEYEINTRNREEELGKGKTSKYIIQAGSFREFNEADKLRARLALLGIESRVEKANVGNVIWNRVKMGPYIRSSSVSVIKNRLKDSGIDVIVIEVKG